MSVAGAPSSAAAPPPAEWHALDAGEALCRAGTGPQSGLAARTSTVLWVEELRKFVVRTQRRADR